MNTKDDSSAARVAALEQEVANLRRETAAKDVQIQQLRDNAKLVPSSPKAEPSQHRIVVNGIEIAWDTGKGTCTFRELPVALMWVDTTLAGLLAGMEGMVGPERFALALQAEGRKSVESDWMIISRYTDFREGFAALSTNAAIAAWGNWRLTDYDPDKRQCRFQVHNNWEGLYQNALGVCWGSGLLAGKLAGICSKLFKTNCWATQTSFVAKGDDCDEFLVAPSDRNLEREIDSLLNSDQATRADMAVALHRLQQTEASLRQQIAGHARMMEELNATRNAALKVMADALEDRKKTEHLNKELLKSESGLRMASAYNRSLIEASLDPLVTIGPDGRITDVNEATEAATGRARSELIGTDFCDCFEDPAQARAGYQQVFREGFVRDYPLELRRGNGKTMSVLYNASLYRGEQGKVIGIFAAARDITDRKRVEAEREQFHKFFNISTDLMVFADPFGCFKQVNPATLQLLGYSEAELLGKPFISFVHPDDRQPTMEEMTRQVKMGRSMDFINRYLCHDGTIRWLSWRANYVEADQTTYATARDITEQRKMEAALKESEVAFRTLAESVPQIVWATRPDGWNIYFNQRWVEYTGLTLEESYGHGWNKPFHPDDQKRVMDAWQNATQNNSDYSLEARLRRADGTYRWWLARGVPQRDAAGNVIKWFGTCTDIHDLKLAEEEIRRFNATLEDRVRERTGQLEAANKELESFSYSVSHDLRAPLRAIDGFSRFVLEDNASQLNAEGKENLGRVRAASQRMGRLIDDLLQLSRYTRSPIRCTLVDLSAMARSVTENLKQAEPDRRVEMLIEPGLTAKTDAGLMEVVLMNLLGNAWKFTGKKSDAKIEFGRTSHAGEPAFFVRDNGAGFDMTYADQLFGTFQRLHSDSEFPGTGIGLATVQRVIHRQNGRVWAEGQIGRGATFYFTLPPPASQDVD